MIVAVDYYVGSAAEHVVDIVVAAAEHDDAVAVVGMADAVVVLPVLMELKPVAEQPRLVLVERWKELAVE